MFSSDDAGVSVGVGVTLVVCIGYVIAASLLIHGANKVANKNIARIANAVQVTLNCQSTKIVTYWAVLDS